MKNFSKLTLTFFVFTTLALLSGCSSDEDNNPPITAAEGLFINEIYASGDDWVELYNATNQIKDISGYIIEDDGAAYILPPGTLVPAEGYLVILCDDENTGLHTNFKLSSDGETVVLKNAHNEVTDVVTYPKLDKGQSYGRYPDGASELSISGVTSQGTSNNDSNAPAITSVFRTPTVPTLNQAVIINAEIIIPSSITISTVKLFYRFEGGTYTEITMTKPGAYYTATIPAQGADVTGTMEYYVQATSTTGATTYKPYDAPGDAYYYILNNDPLPSLFINEIMASQTSCCPDEAGEYDDWFELYNAGDEDVNLSGMYLSDNLSDPFKAKIPNGIIIPAKGFLVFWADEQGSQGPLHLNFKLSKGGEAVGLFYIDGRPIDSKEFSDQDDNKSFERSTDGGSTWQQTITPTPGASNNP